MKQRTFLILSISVLIALWFRGASYEFWFDERFVQMISAQPFPRMLELLQFENSPPIFFMLTWFWQRIVGESEIALRVITLLPAALALIVLYEGTLRRLGERAANATVLLCLLSALLIYASVEFRAYTWSLLWTALGLELASRYQEDSRKRIIWSLVAVLVLGVLTHYVYALVAVAILGYVVVSASRKSIPAIAGLVVGLSALPWFSYGIFSRLGSGTLPTLEHVATSHWEPLIFASPLAFRWTFPDTTVVLWWVLAALATFAIVRAVVGIRSGADAARSYLTLNIMVLLVGVAVLSLTGLALPKYSVIILPSLTVAIGYGLTKLSARTGTTILVVLLILSGWSSLIVITTPKTNYRATFSAMDIRPEDKVLVFPFNDEIAVRPYAPAGVQTFGFFPLAAPGAAALEDIVLYNYRKTLSAENVDRLREYVGDSPRVWLLTHVYPGQGPWQGNLIAEWFERNGFRATVYREIFKNVPPLLVRYDRQV